MPEEADTEAEQSTEAPAESAAEAPPAPAAEAPSEPPQPTGLWSRLNPFNLFRRETPQRYVKDGQFLLENKNFAQATVAFNTALSLDANCAGAYQGLGLVLVKKGGRMNLDTALKHYDQAILLDPFNEDNFSVTARIYEKLGKRKEATLQRKKMIIVKTLTTDPRNSVANNNMGILLLQQKQEARAIEYFEKSIECNIRYDVAYRNLAATLYQQALAMEDSSKRTGPLDLAKGQICKALEIIETVSSLLVHCKILMAEDHLEEALEASERAEAIEEANKNVYGIKKLIYERMNRMEEAQTAFEKYQLYSRNP